MKSVDTQSVDVHTYLEAGVVEERHETVEDHVRPWALGNSSTLLEIHAVSGRGTSNVRTGVTYAARIVIV